MNLARPRLTFLPHVLVALIGCVSVVPGWAAGEKHDEIVELPKFVVTDTRALPAPESWRYGTIPGFEILSNASEKTTRQLIRDFYMFRQALEIVWPMPVQMNTPVLLILCGKGGQFESFMPANSEAGPEVTRASVYLKGRARSAIVIDVESTVINLLSMDADDPSSGIDATRFAIEHNKQLYREYVHYLLSRSEPRLPAWFEEGMAQIVMAMKFDPKYIEFGRIDEAGTVSATAGAIAKMNAAMNAANASANSAAMGSDPDFQSPAAADMIPGAPAEDRDFNNALHGHWLMPVKELLAVSRDSPAAMNPLGNNTWAKQCYAFVHMGLFGEDGHWRKPFSEFLLRSTTEPVTEQLFKECFKMSYRDMGIQLRGYVDGTRYTAQIYHAKDGRKILTDTKVDFRDATQAEVGRIKGEAKLLAGHLDAARTEFIAPYIRGERDPQLLAELGLCEQSAGKDDRARKFLAAAVTARTTDADAYLELARYKYSDAIRALTDAKSAIPEAAASEILKLLLAARTIVPPNPATYELFADTLARSAKRPTKNEIYPLVEGVQLFPRDLRLVYKTAALCVDAGVPEAADSLAEHGIKTASDPMTRQAFERLKSQLPPIAAAAAPQKPTGAPAKN